MDNRPAYFVVERVMGREQPSIFWDELPRSPSRRFIYVVRLDQQPNGTVLVKMALGRLMEMYRDMKTKGTLPPRWEPPRPQSPTGARQGN